MINKQLDEDSLRVQINLIDIKENKEMQKDKAPLFSNGILSSTKEYITSLHDYLIDRYFSLKKVFAVQAIRASKTLNSLKSYFVTKMFWGRGSFYRYIVIVSVFIPITISLFIIYNNRTQPLKQRSIVLTNAVINQAATNTNKVAVEGKVVESDTTTQTAPNQGLISWYTADSSDTLDSIAKKFNISTDTISIANNLTTDKITAGQVLAILPVTGISYTVKQDDTVQSIAKYYKVSDTQLALWNLIDATKPIPVGKKILIPGATHDEEAALAAANTPQYNMNALASAGCPADDTWCYLQTDPRWAAMILGGSGRVNNYYYMNMRNIGCLVTDVAMISDYYYPERHITPGTIAYNPSYFAGGGLFTLSGLGLFNVSSIGYVNGRVDWNEIDQQLGLGHPVIVGFAYRDHYVVVYKKVGNDYLINDPAYGGSLLLSKYYTARYASQAYLYTPITK